MPVNYPALAYGPDYGVKWKFVDTTIRSDFPGYEQTRASVTRRRKEFELTYTSDLSPDDEDSLKIMEDAVGIGGGTIYWANPVEAYRNKPWVANHVYAAGEIVRPTVATGRSYICIQAGTAHDTEPGVGGHTPWPTTVNGTLTDGTVIWRENTYTVRLTAPINYDYPEYSLSGVQIKFREA